MADTNIIFEDRFTVDTIDQDGKKFDRVSRITGKSHNLSMHLTLDIASELYPLSENETITLAVARSLVPDEVKRELWRSGDQGLAADFEYVMFGKIYKFDDSLQGENQTTAYFSFGGLLMALRGSYRHLAGVVQGENVYLLIRK
ncbi:DNA-directed RNA polymerases i, ii, and iii 17.1 kda polypeptide [Kockovaella imperatae]|uniref:DNA-directed RNA polymerases I, II, and III subunit RPABC3 n=1 Tax=Kockovaella imperatae TaxID=4999 RepID=A0A1Y1UR63_9TREE|nr:DNA-directed RNA polymerases i, ii, and iii 17.1 kda polypeptide [Kockovaella imperatae]ORX40568.1 DNA-directed RNA polymerases i, ii, and iii 17.1 kda polypeptide [Kockovaella imperatae]